MKLLHLMSVLAIFVLTAGAAYPSSVVAAAVSEQEPNNTAATAQLLTGIGLDNPLHAELTQADQDWYTFEAVQGQTYIVELFNVSNTVSDYGGDCVQRSGFGGYGLGLFIYRPALGEAQAGSCNANDLAANPAGNSHRNTQFTAGVNGIFYIKILANNQGVSGTYSLRVLPKFDEPGAVWDNTMYEPNNVAAIAYPMNAGRENALNVAIEPRSATYGTFYGDVDWYRFEAVQGRTYVVELFNVSNTFVDYGGDCVQRSGFGAYGLGLFVYRPALGEAQAGSCNANDLASNPTGNTHRSTQFTAGVSGTFYIKVLANSANVSGSYSLRVLPKFDEPGATWDNATYEPNNIAASAFPLQVGAADALASGAIEPRNQQFATFGSDRDWFVFSGTEGQQYTVELINVDPSLTVNGPNCVNRSGFVGRGMALFAYSSANLSEPLAGQCSASGQGRVHASAKFTVGSTGLIYILTFPNKADVSGSYTIRVCPGECSLGERVYIPLIRK